MYRFSSVLRKLNWNFVLTPTAYSRPKPAVVEKRKREDDAAVDDEVPPSKCVGLDPGKRNVATLRH